MPTTSAAAAKSFRGARLIKFLYKARRRCRATYHSMQAGRLLLRSLPAIVMVSMLVPPPVAAQAPAGNSVAAEVQSSASGKLKKFYRPRSEEHTSELQSLMHISNAVFCLQKKQNITRK